jgi:hypothetical protein
MITGSFVRDVFDGRLGVVQLHPDGHLVLLDPRLQLAQLVDLLRHLGNRILLKKQKHNYVENTNKKALV